VSWLLDTNVISELRKPRCHEGVKIWADKQSPKSMYLSTVTMAEIRFGIEQLSDEARHSTLSSWLESELRSWFAGRILAVDEDVILEWRRMVARGRSVRHTFSQPDLFIAAIASVHKLCVVTRNVKDFQVAEVSVLDPWKQVS
jgi:toxin FitB